MSEKSQRLNIYRITHLNIPFEEISNALLDESYELENEVLDGTLRYKLFIQRNKFGQPRWYELLAPLVDPDKECIRTMSSSFILFVQYGNKIYAVTGGFGYTKVKKLIDEDFGLVMALRIMDPNAITALTQKSIKGTVRQVHRAVIGYDPMLDIENYNRFLKSVEGKSIDERFGVRISAKSSLLLTKKIRFDQFEELFELIEELYEKPQLVYFPKSYSLVDDDNLINELNNALINDFNHFIENEDNIDKFYIEFHDLFEQFKCQTYKLKINRTLHDLDFLTLLQIKAKLQESGITVFREINNFKKIKLNGYDENNLSVIDNEDFLKLLVFENDLRGSSYLFYNLHWFKIHDDFKTYIDEQISKITLNTSLPCWDHNVLSNDTSEKGYNLYVAGINNWESLDRDCVFLQDCTQVEVCDLYDKETKRFIHVKKVWGSKTSYLLAQGLVSATLHYQSEEFRDICKRKWPELFDGDFYPESIVVYGIADNKALDHNFPLNLTFFSKINLVDTVARLRSWGYRVELAPIEVRT